MHWMFCRTFTTERPHPARKRFFRLLDLDGKSTEYCKVRTVRSLLCNKNTPNATITIKAVNELIPGSVKIVKVSEDGKVDGITFRIQGNGIDKTVKTANDGVIQVDNLKP
jgi:hypothetical protein